MSLLLFLLVMSPYAVRSHLQNYHVCNLLCIDFVNISSLRSGVINEWTLSAVAGVYSLRFFLVQHSCQPGVCDSIRGYEDETKSMFPHRTVGRYRQTYL